MTTTDFNYLQTIAGLFDLQAVEIRPVTQGLINHTYRVLAADGKEFLLQQINTRVFTNPVLLQENFVKITKITSKKFTVPELITTAQGEPVLNYQERCWRCFSFIKNSFAPASINSEEMANSVANCFGTYTRVLSEANPRLHTVLPGFHDLDLRLNQLQDKIKYASPDRLQRCRLQLKWAAEDYYWIIDRYRYWSASKELFPLRILHHDCKVSNILFGLETNRMIGPIDLDTTQPGLFFSDLGDMIRSIVPAFGENEVVETMPIRVNYLEAVMDGYLAATSGMWTGSERQNLHLSGHVLLYMQAIRFLADYLDNDRYYPVAYPAQNYDRAYNQWQALHSLSRLPGAGHSKITD